MTEDFKKETINTENIRDLDDICDDCKKKNESVSHNLILIGFKICESCRLSKTIFPI
tara:strand:- start:187 stop:357 length:171 start_codon:yes stop_codon:yes gene_type:complete